MTRLMQLSDIHFGAEIPEAVEGLVKAATELGPDMVLIGGDFTMRARRREWRASVEFLERLPVPTLSIPGNHDIPALNNFLDRIFRPFASYKKAIGEDLEPSVVIGDVEIVGLNTARAFAKPPSFDWSTGSVSVAQCLGLPLRFKAETPLRAVMIHHPVRAPERGDRRLLKRDGMFLAALEKAGVDLLMAGHFHQSYAAAIPLPLGESDIVLSHVSTACSWRTKGESPGFHMIEAGRDHIRVIKYEFDEATGEFGEAGAPAFAQTGAKWKNVGAEPEDRT